MTERFDGDGAHRLGTPGPLGRWTLHGWRGAALVAVLAAAAYANTAGHGFVLDDATAVMTAPHVTDGPGLHLLRPARTGQGDYYRPLAFALFSVDHALGHGDPMPFHLTCIALHIIASLMVWLLGRALVGEGAALLGALLFAVHPVHTEAVANIWNRSEVQATIFYVAGLLVFLWPGWRREAARWGAVNLVWLLALLSKESAVTFPATLVLVSWVRRGGRPRLGPALACVPALAVYGVLRWAAMAGAADASVGRWMAGVGLSDHLAFVGRMVVETLRLLVAPLTLRADYTRPTLTPTMGWSPSAAVGLLALAVGIVLTVAGARRGRAWAGVLGLAGVSMLPYLHLGAPVGLPIAERWAYLPSVGACLLAGWGLGALGRWPRATLAGGLVVAGLALTLARNADWSSNLALWSAEVERPDASAFAHGNMGYALWNAGEPERAITELRRAVGADPRGLAYRRVLAGMLRDIGDLPGAVEVLRGGLEHAPDPAYRATVRKAEEALRARGRGTGG